MNRCLNPACGKSFKPGNYGARQQVCTGSYSAKCPKCPGKGCPRCAGRGTFKRLCRDWYKAHQLATAPPPRGLGDAWAAILKGANAVNLPLRHRVLLRVARSTGLRKGELLGLTWGDVFEFGNGLENPRARQAVTVRGKWSDVGGFELTKTGASRVAYLDAEARAAIELLYKFSQVADKKAGVVEVPNPVARIWHLSCAGAWLMFVTLQRKLGIANPATRQPFRFHDLRHSTATEIAQKTGDLALVAQVLGHKSLESSRKYVTRTAGEVVGRLEEIRGKKGGKR
ncbi:MAG: tyrosine-type recombinase/integrase [Vicinamibacteria bacterium]